jgi:formate hydrogenlyase subunit 3/multisubunit Na+/H+ antiporter MnhD subunit
MEADGVLDEILNKYSTDTCDANASASKIDYTIALDKTAGIFIILSCVVALLFSISFGRRRFKFRHVEEKASEEKGADESNL